MEVDVATADVQDVYRLLIGVVTPRPIAWVSTVSSAGVVNLAPFSFFNAFGANPPVVAFSPTLNRLGEKKDTLRNVEATGEFVVNAAVASLAELVNLSAKECLPDESEITLTGLHTTPSTKVRPPRVTESPASLECRVRQIIPCGTGPIAPHIVIGDVVAIYVHDDVLDAVGQIDPRKIQTVGRLGGDFWCHTSTLFEQKRP